MLDKMIASIKSNKFLLVVSIIVAVIVGYIVVRILGIFFTFIFTAFFVSMYKAKDRRKHILALEIISTIIVIGGVLLFLLFANHEWPLH